MSFRLSRHGCRLLLVGFVLFQLLFLLSSQSGDTRPSAILAIPYPASDHSSSSSGGALGPFMPRAGPVAQLANVTIRRMILVPCHAALRVVPGDTSDEASWQLETHLYGTKIVETITRHIRVALDLAANDPNSIVMFSGGQTKLGTTWSEGASYYQHAVRHQWWGHGTVVSSRVFVEEDARDSFENLLYSSCRFHQLTGRYAEHVTVVGMRYKAARFRDHHRTALRMPPSYMTYVGADYDGAETTHPLDDSRSVAVFRQDPFGCRGNERVREGRNPLRRGISYYDPTSCPALVPLLSHCSTTKQSSSGAAVAGPLPWDESPHLLLN